MGKCISSLIVDHLMDKVEIIIVNDGSTDNTESIALGYVNQYPGSILLVNKKNGGHGSAVNIAVKRATGRYFKVIDADDWIMTDNLSDFLEQLEIHDVDAVINSFCTVNLRSGRIIRYSVNAANSREVVLLDRLIENYHQISACCSIHGITYNLDTYMKSGCQLSEGVSYDDNEYATLPFSHINKVLLLPFDFYQYQIGNSEQSVSLQNQVKRIGHLILVANSILDFWETRNDISAASEKYYMLKTAQVFVSVFATCLVKNPLKASGRKLADEVWHSLKSRKPEIAAQVRNKYRTLRVLNILHLPGSLYQWATDFKIYKKFRLWWSK